MVKDIFFDLDRTLWDFETNSENALNIMFDEFNMEDYIEDFDSFLTHYKNVNSKFWKKYNAGEITKEELRNGRFSETLEIFQINNKKLGIEMNDRYLELSPYQTQLFPDTIEVLDDLKNQNYHIHIITNGFQKVQHLKIQNSGLSPYFDTILCSEEVGKNKPHPEVFLTALERSDAVSDDSIMIGDDFQADVIGAENVGIRGVLFDPN